MDLDTSDATATLPVVETEDQHSTDIRATAGGDVMPTGKNDQERIGTSSISSSSVGLLSPGRGGSSGGGKSTAPSSIPQLPISERESSEWGGSEISSKKGGGPTRRLFRDGSLGAKGSSLSVRSLGNPVSFNGQHVSVTAFLKAAGEGDKRTVKSFLKSGGDVNVKGKTGTSTALSRAAAKGHVKIVTLLLQRGAAVNIPGRGGLTPLHEAAGCGQVEACHVLLGAGAAVAARDHWNRCPLHYANNSLEVTKLLLDFGADPDAKDKNGQRADTLSVNPEARALLRDARFAVREYAVGDNASRVIASLRRELENLQQETQAAKDSAANEAERVEKIQLEVVRLRNKISELHQEVEYHKKEAAAALARINRARAEIPDTTEAELKQLRATLRVARAAAAEEKKRRVSLEEHFDANVSEAVAKAIAAAATRLLDKMPEEEEEGEEVEGMDQEREREQRFEAIADAATRLLGDMPEKEEEEEEGANQERDTGDVERELFRRREGDDYLSDTKEHDHGDGDASRPEHAKARAQPSVARGGEGEDGSQGNMLEINIVPGEDALSDEDGDISEEGTEDTQGRGWAENVWKGLFRFCLPSTGNRHNTLPRNVN